MKISLNWLKEYIDIRQSPEEVSEILTMIGLEVEGMEVVEEVPGGLAGVVVGKVKECTKHPNADKLSLTKVDIGKEELLQIVCGAPNVATGQKVLVATIGTTLFPRVGDPWKIKKGKIRGELSEGMICAEDELGLGQDHSGIMVLDDHAQIGISAKDHLGLERDIVFEIGLTPNRSDATSHLGVAKDFAAYLKINTNDEVNLKTPDLSEFKVDMFTKNVKVEVRNPEACPRYSGVVIDDLQIGESPKWLKNYLNAIDVRPINNVVDITNFVLHEYGQPLHAFDYDKIAERKIIVQTCQKGTAFNSLDEKERILSDEDLMICDGKGKGMCIGGVFGGIDSGVTDQTKTIFLESAHFSASWIRKTSTRHLLRTDAAKVFEKGSDPNKTVQALKRAALLMKKLAGATITSDLVDIYPKKIDRKEIHVKYNHINRLIGAQLSKDEVHQILRAMDMWIKPVDEASVKVSVPTDKADVTREVDVIEEILRIYGFNKVELSEGLTSKVYYTGKINKHTIRNKINHLLSNQGLSEIMGMSLIESKCIIDTKVADREELVYINNTSNIHLDIMRPEMMISGLTSVVYNHNRQNLNLKLFEIGKGYQKHGEEYRETEYLSIFLSGREKSESWRNDNKSDVDFYSIKTVVYSLLHRLGIERYQVSELEDSRMDYGLLIHQGKKVFCKLGKVSQKIKDYLELKTNVFYAEIEMESIYEHKRKATRITELSKYPAVRRDLAVVVDQAVKFSTLEQIARKTNKKYMKEINLFDVYNNEEHVGKGKKSYALSFVFADDTKTLKDKEVDKIMQQLIHKYETEVAAEIRR